MTCVLQLLWQWMALGILRVLWCQCLFAASTAEPAAEEPATEEPTSEAPAIAVSAPKPPENRSLGGEACYHYLLNVNAHGGGFWATENLDYYHRCLWVLRHAGASVLPRSVAVGGRHYPTVILTNHREPAMKLPPEKLPRRPRRPYSAVPMQAFGETQPGFARPELRVPFHFVLPFFDVNIGNIIKEQGSMNHYQSYQMQTLVRQGDTAIDVGGNLGCYTLSLAEAVGPGGRVIAFEPFRWMHQVLTANVAANGFMNVWPVNAALGREAALVDLLPPQFRFFSSPGGVKVEDQASQVKDKPLHEVFQLYDLTAAAGEETVRVVRLDDLLLSDSGRWWGLPRVQDVRLIKIDVEGMEVAVVEGAAETIRAFKPIVWAENTAYFESNGKDTRFLQVMASVGYYCSKSEAAPQDVICVDETGAGHQV